jgi:hypothetical protein
MRQRINENFVVGIIGWILVVYVVIFWRFYGAKIPLFSLCKYIARAF